MTAMDEYEDYGDLDPTPEEVAAAILRLQTSGEGSRVLRSEQTAVIPLESVAVDTANGLQGELTVVREVLKFPATQQKAHGQMSWQLRVRGVPNSTRGESVAMSAGAYSGTCVLESVTFGPEVTATYRGVGELAGFDSVMFRHPSITRY